jgi:hypothetical protein
MPSAATGGRRTRRADGGARRLPPRTVEIFRAIPVGSRRARSQMAWVADVLDDSDFVELRADRRRNWAEIVRVLARYADWKDRTTRPTWARVGDQAGVSRRTVARAIEWLHERGYLGTVESGSTPLFRIGVLYGLAAAGEGHRAAEYVLCAPGRTSDRRPIQPNPTRPVAVCPRGSGTPSGSRKGPRTTPTREDSTESTSDRHWPATRRPVTRGEALAAAETLRRRNPVLRRLTARHLRSLAKAYWAAGWTPADVLYAMEHLPNGRQHPQTHSVRHVAGWLRYRLACWHTGGGGLYPTPGQLAAEHARRVRAEQAQRAVELTVAQAARVDAAEHAAAARSRLPVVSVARHTARRNSWRPRWPHTRPCRRSLTTSRMTAPSVLVPPGRDCDRCGAVLDPDGSCFMCDVETLAAAAPATAPRVRASCL